MKTSKLSGAHLDYWVAKAAGDHWGSSEGFRADLQQAPYSTEWTYGGPIIERERIQLWPDYCYPGGATDQWRALRQGPWSDEQDRMNDTQPLGEGRTPLIAAMRAYVASKLGEVVELP